MMGEVMEVQCFRVKISYTTFNSLGITLTAGDKNIFNSRYWPTLYYSTQALY